MPQNVYDRQDFFENYIKLDRQVKGLHGAPEWPQLKSILPNLNGLVVLDLGCVFGWFSRFARENAAEFVRAIDISEKMLERAQEMTSLICSIEHPIYTAPSRPRFIVDEETGSKSWPLDDYQKEGLRTTDWLAPGI
ncbi:hypothetical protein F5Y00DRAFT_155744 [Daldinia vernicosa]|uniref:uncharacterized protein n=1 Tax=Daldinia vernicosa TaxID=114800 RepID=UPI0020085A43|nr:uncharacterized protein F5Y00DRAFT_155744 [Daldinia vernicosa]KAI0852855.1 hypothetical protein F5Y00DRAFT_155744 [Daldinia vernicosa]